MVKTSGGKSKRKTRKQISPRQIRDKFIHTKNSIIQTIDYGMRPLLKIQTVGGTILDDVNFKSAQLAFEYFLEHSTPRLFKANSLSGRIIQLDLNEGVQSPYTSYNRNTFINLTIGDIKSLIVKFILIGDKDELVPLSNQKRLLISTVYDLKQEYILQNYIASKTANSDPNNKYLMAAPYNVYSNYNKISSRLSDKFAAYLLKHKANKLWPEFYRLGIRKYNIGVIAMTKVEGMIGDTLLNKDIYSINQYKLGRELSQISLSPSSPPKELSLSPSSSPKKISTSNITTLLEKYLERNKKTLLQHSRLHKYTMSKTDKEFTKHLLKIYSPYISIIYSILRVAIYTGYIHTDLHQDNYFIISENTDFFSLSRAIIIDWGEVHPISSRDRDKYLQLWNQEKFRELLDKLLKILFSFNRPPRLNNTYYTLSELYNNVLGKTNTGILLKMYHNQCKIRTQYYNNKINRLWSSLDNTLSILELETYLLTAEERFGKGIYPSMQTNLLMQDGYNKRSKTLKIKSPTRQKSPKTHKTKTLKATTF